jgi:Fe(II)/alpha-ketoglutarate-dependent arginine beta-hydroxylase
MFKYTLNQQEIQAVESLVGELLARKDTVPEHKFFQDITLYAHELPRQLREFMLNMKYGDRAGAWIVAGFPVDDQAIGHTPAHWSQATEDRTKREETAFALCSALLGDMFGWATQQNGRIIHNLIPIPGHEHEQLGSGSTTVLAWHTEEAFHPLRCDYLALMCLRNPDRVPTTFASVDMVNLSDEVRQTLFEPRFMILPDNSHFTNYSVVGKEEIELDQLLSNAYHGIAKMNSDPEKIPVLYGHRNAPYMAVDPYYMRVPENDKKAQNALNALTQAIDEQLQDIVLSPGDCLYIDNYRSVHGRKAFKPRYDGTDRWLKRINLTRDLRKSRASRADSTSRVIY